MSMHPLTVVMYHYVRPLSRSQYPSINGLDIDDFRGQIDYIQANYTVVRMEDVAEALASGTSLPPRSVLLTFDDGYTDHYRYVYPILSDRGLQGSFYVPRATALERDILDVNKIHYILAAVADHDRLVRDLDCLIAVAQDRFGPIDVEELRTLYYVPNRYDSAAVNYFKRVLQHALPLPLRGAIASELFARFVSTEARAFAEDLYMSLDQMRLMAKSGMHFGGHGDKHLWMSRSTADQKSREAQGAVELLDMIGVSQGLRTYCYPYGDYDPSCMDVLKANGFNIAFTSRSRLACLGQHGQLELPRVDTNDLPVNPNSARNKLAEEADIQFYS